MNLQEHVPLKAKTTMRIGGTALYYGEIVSKDDLEEAIRFAHDRSLPLLPLGGGSNTIFTDDGEINALIIRLKADHVRIDGNIVTVDAGKTLAVLINELANADLDLSPLTGIPGTVGGAVFGNAGQGPKGVWLDSYVTDVTVYMDNAWRTMPSNECSFRYRESLFKDRSTESGDIPPIIWSVTLSVPSRPKADILRDVEHLIERRIETQPHRQTAGSCFKAIGDQPAWQLIEAAGLRGMAVGGVQVSEKHANFLLNTGNGTFADACAVVEKVRGAIPETLEVEMRFVAENGRLMF